MTKSSGAAKSDLKAKIFELLDENRVMSVATLRPDGWPQATMVGYVHDDLTLYFAVGRTSQKLANIKLDPRISLALGHDWPNRLRGLSIAAQAEEVMSVSEVGRLNTLLHQSYPEQAMFSPREASSAVIRATPMVVSIIDLARGPGEPDLVRVNPNGEVGRIRNLAKDAAGKSGEVTVRYVHIGAAGDRRDAPF